MSILDPNVETRIAAIIQDVTERRGRGELVSDLDLINEHADLLPELGEYLASRRRVEAALGSPNSDRFASFHPAADAKERPNGDDREPSRPMHGRQPVLDFEFVERIHEGGQGVVFRVVNRATGRTSAMKVTRRSLLADADAVERFDREKKILALMEHKNIVAIHDAGRWDGYAYYVMDFVEGRPIDEYVESLGRPIKKTLRLFIKVCEAVGRVHTFSNTRYIVHRDLKPSNIMVDAQGEPHILDFGLAKVTQTPMDLVGSPSRNRDDSDLSLAGQFIGTPAWAAPEQFGGDPATIDPRTDVYSLGVILYKLLTGHMPYDTQSPFADVAHHITHEPPKKPRALRRTLDDDTQTILLKCLSKEREGRYENANELGNDLGHLLAGEPIIAKRHTVWYWLLNYAHRHKKRLIAACLLIVVIGGLIGRLLLERQRSLTTLRFATSVINKSNPLIDGQELNPELAKDLMRMLRDNPKLVASLPDNLVPALLETVGTYQLGAGAMDDAVEMLSRAIVALRNAHGESSPQTAEAINHHGLALLMNGDFDAAERELRKSLSLFQNHKGDYSFEITTVKKNLAEVLRNKGAFADAEELLAEVEQTLRKLSRPLDLAQCFNNQGVLFMTMGRFAEARLKLDRALAEYQEFYSNKDPNLATVIVNVGALNWSEKNYEAAVKSFKQSCEMRESIYPSDHIALAEVYNGLATSHQHLGNFDQADEYYRKALQIWETRLPKDHPNIFIGMTNFADNLQQRGRHEDALREFLKCLAFPHSTYFEDKDIRNNVKNRIVEICTELGRFEEAEKLVLQWYEETTAKGGEDSPAAQDEIKRAVKLYDAWGRFEDVKAWKTKLLPQQGDGLPASERDN